jgi:hypothetical protein
MPTASKASIERGCEVSSSNWMGAAEGAIEEPWRS